MANEDSIKSSANLKVPPLKIVLSSHQNNTVVNRCSNEDDQFKSTENKLDCNNEHIVKEPSRRSSLEPRDTSDKPYKRVQKGSTERTDTEAGQPSTKFQDTSSSGSSTSSFVDRLSSPSPSSESESLASNSTIISESPQVKVKAEIREESTHVRSERSSRCNPRSQNERSTPREQTTESTSAGSRELASNANQRITRSSQRAAQQVKFDNPNDQTTDDANVCEVQDKVQETARKVKRRKNELPETEPDASQVANQPNALLANFCPADYRLPPYNSFQLYRDIRKRPHRKLFKLSRIHPKLPHGFKDFLMNSGPYLLDGHKLGNGLNGSKLDNINKDSRMKSSSGSRSVAIHSKSSRRQPTFPRHSSYIIPEPCLPPASLPVSSPLYELFLEQEKSRQQMRMQHLKERERATLAAEQEILRIYNRAAITDLKQKLNFSACTYFYYQERYHYANDKSQANRRQNGVKQENVNDENEMTTSEIGGKANSPKSDELEDKMNQSTDSTIEMSIDQSTSTVTESIDNDGKETGDEKNSMRTHGSNSDQAGNSSIGGKSDTNGHSGPQASEKATDSSTACQSAAAASTRVEPTSKSADLDSDNSMSELLIGQDGGTRCASNQGSNLSNKEVFQNQLQEVDDKWDTIRRDMLVRHKNEADSLYAVQTMEWEWKAKEIGACDVRVPLRVGQDYVAKVEISPLDY